MLGAILHYGSVFIDGREVAFAYVERSMSAKDRPGRYCYAATKFGTECILGLGRSCGYVPVGAVAEGVATIEGRGLHFAHFKREPFSEDLWNHKGLAKRTQTKCHWVEISV